MRKHGNTILVTGGGSGIGRELARAWHEAGNEVIVAGRTMASLEETIAGRDGMHAMRLDAADAADITRFASDLLDRFPSLNVVVNNAGIMPYEDISRSRDLTEAHNVIHTNLLGPIRLTDALIDHLKSVADGVLVNVTSGLAHVPMPKAATYSATKAALHSYTVSLRKLLDGVVEVIELVPPGVQTELTPGQSHREGFMPLDDFIDETMSLFAQQPTPPEICVDRVKPLRNAEANGDFAEKLDMIASL